MNNSSHIVKPSASHMRAQDIIYFIQKWKWRVKTFPEFLNVHTLLFIMVSSSLRYWSVCNRLCWKFNKLVFFFLIWWWIFVINLEGNYCMYFFFSSSFSKEEGQFSFGINLNLVNVKCWIRRKCWDTIWFFFFWKKS